jgi:hypothetical protein
MIKKKIIQTIILAVFALILPTSCTDLSETVYGSVMSENYYQTKSDVIRAVFRPFEHVYTCAILKFELEELSADQIITPTRDDWWYDGGKWERYHYHTWTIDEETWQATEWTNMYAGIGQCNLVLDDLERLDPADFDISTAEFANFKAQLRTMRAYCYIRLLSAYRNIILTTTSDEAINSRPEKRSQVSPKATYDFIESELLWAINNLASKEGMEGNGLMQGQFTKAAASGLLAR